MLDLREDLAVLGATVRSGSIRTPPLAGAKRRKSRFQPERAISLPFAAAVVISFTLYMAGVFTRTPFLAVLLDRNGLRLLSRPQTNAKVAAAVRRHPTTWPCWRNSCERLESETFRAPLLQQLQRD
jgi:hypothetical protein